MNKSNKLEAFLRKSPPERELELSELKFWLEGDTNEAREWRADIKNGQRVSQMIRQYAATPGGKTDSVVIRKIAQETHVAQQRVEEQKAIEAKHESLKALRWKEYQTFGVTQEQFEEQWPTLLLQMLADGSAESALEADAAKRREASVSAW